MSYTLCVVESQQPQIGVIQYPMLAMTKKCFRDLFAFEHVPLQSFWNVFIHQVQIESSVIHFLTPPLTIFLTKNATNMASGSFLSHFDNSKLKHFEITGIWYVNIINCTFHLHNTFAMINTWVFTSRRIFTFCGVYKCLQVYNCIISSSQEPISLATSV